MTNAALDPILDSILAIRDLHAWYGESHVLHGIGLDVPEGQVVTLLGRNGAGKSTTLKSVMGIVPRRRGSIRLGGAETIGLRPFHIARHGVAFCPEDRGIYATLDVKEHLELPTRVGDHGLSTEQVLDLFPHLRERLNSPGTKLSGGEQQMLAIGRTLRTGARLLLLDEPLRRAGAQHRGTDRRHYSPPQGAGIHHPAGGAEPALRHGCGRPVLSDRPRPGGGAL
nr:ATP-binding cassette domain-containing protein [Halomonas bachuensis]